MLRGSGLAFFPGQDILRREESAVTGMDGTVVSRKGAARGNRPVNALRADIPGPWAKRRTKGGWDYEKDEKNECEQEICKKEKQMSWGIGSSGSGNFDDRLRRRQGYLGRIIGGP